MIFVDSSIVGQSLLANGGSVLDLFIRFDFYLVMRKIILEFFATFLGRYLLLPALQPRSITVMVVL